MSQTGALSPVTQYFYYETANCSGTPFEFSYNYQRQTAVVSANPAETGLYTYGDQASSTDIRSLWSGFGNTCQTYSFTQPSMVVMVAIPAGDVPPTLTGPLSYVPAG
jgi:hypothetical protein